MTRLAALVTRRPRAVLVGWVVLLLLLMPLAGKLADAVSRGGYEVPGSGSARVEQVLGERGDGTATQPLFLVVDGDGDGDRDRLRARAEGAARAAGGAEDVLGSGPARLSESGRTAIVPIELRGDLGEAQRALPGLRAALDERGYEQVVAIGQAAAFDASTEIAKQDLERAERVGLPITLAILLLAFLSLVAAGLPLVLGTCALIASFAALYGFSLVFETNAFVTNMALFLGLGLSIDYALFMVTRFREGLAGGASPADALATAYATTGRAILWSGVTVALSLASLLVVGVEIYTSLALGATIAAAVAMIGSLTLLPALLMLLGPRVNRLGLRRAARAAAEGRVWRRLAQLVLAHRRLFAAGSVLLLLLACAPLLSTSISFPSTSILLPAGSGDEAAASARVARELGAGATAPIELLTRTEPERVRALVAADAGVVAAAAPTRAPDGWWRIVAIGRDEDNTPAAVATVARLRDRLAAVAPSALVGGQTAQGSDLVERVESRLPLVIATAVLVTLLLLIVAFRSIVVPVKAVLTNLLAVGASLGILTLLFQGLGDSDAIAHFVPLFLFAVLFGLSMDYEVLLISRIREEYLAGADSDTSIARGLVRSARSITLAAAAMITVFATGAASQLEPFRQLGVGMSLAILLDATLVRCVLVPSAMALLGPRNWWFPRARAREARATPALEAR